MLHVVPCRLWWVGCILALLCAAVPGAAATPAEFKRARNLFEYGDYQAAVPVLEELVLPGRLEDEADIMATHRMLGVAYHQLGRLPEAEREFKSLLYLDPDAQLDPFLTPPDVVDFFDRVKADMHERLPQLRELRAREKAEADRKRQDATRPPSTEPQTPVVSQPGTVTVRRVQVVPWWVVVLPLGIPQFLMGHWLRGAAVLGLSLLAPLPNLVFFGVSNLIAWGCLRPPAAGTTNPVVALCNPRTPTPVTRSQDTTVRPVMDALYVAQVASLTLVLLAYAVGVVDALILPTRETVLEQSAPPAAPVPLRPRVDPSVPLAPPAAEAAPARPSLTPAPPADNAPPADAAPP